MRWMRRRVTGDNIHETDLGRNLVYPPGAQRVWLSLVQQVHVSVYSSEQDLAIGIDRTRDMITKFAETVKDVTVATDRLTALRQSTTVGPSIPAADC